MSRLAASVILLCAASLAAGQTRKPGEPVRLTLSPAALPRPSLKYRLLPSRDEQLPGNAATHYYRSEAMFADNTPLRQELGAAYWETWRGMPLADLPLEQVRAKLEMMQAVLDELDRASLCRDCNWQLEGRPEGVRLRLPELQPFRILTGVLQVRVRYHLARHDFAAAARALRTGVALSLNLSRGPALIHVLVGAALGSILVGSSTGSVQEYIRQPGAPNLYWSLAVLPRPFYNLQDALRNEATQLDRTWPWLKKLDGSPMTEDEVAAAWKTIDPVLPPLQYPWLKALDRVRQCWPYIKTYPEARLALLREGMTHEQVSARPCFQVVTLYALREYRRAWDDYAPWFSVRHPWKEPGFRKAEERYQAAGRRLDALLFAGRLGGFPTVYLFRFYPGLESINRRVDALRCIEALRLYAAEHGGNLPATLKDVRKVPIPDDPWTNLPFVYKLHGDRATLSATSLPGQAPAYFALKFELTIRR